MTKNILDKLEKLDKAILTYGINTETLTEEEIKLLADNGYKVKLLSQSENTNPYYKISK